MVQSLVREMAMVLSSAAENSLPLAGKSKRVMARSWWVKLPKERLRGFSTTTFVASEGSEGWPLALGGTVETL